MWDSASFDTRSFSTTSWDFGVVDVPQVSGGWPLREWKKKTVKEEALRDVIIEEYKSVGVIPDSHVVKSLGRVVQKQAPVGRVVFKDYSDVSEWLEIRRKIIHRLIAEQMERDDEEAVMLLM